MKRKHLLTTLLITLVLLAAALQPAHQANSAVPAQDTPGPNPAVTVSPQSGAPGTTFTFTFTGFGPGERIGQWLIDPVNWTRDPDERLYADDSGQVTWQWTAPPNAPGGTWICRARGYRGDRPTVSTSFVINAPAFPESYQSTYMVMPAARGARGTTFTFVSRGGFWPNEQVGTWFVQPDGSEIHLNEDISSDDAGQIYKEWTAPQDAMGGDWFFRAIGRNSSHHISIPFHIDSAAAVVDNPANISADPTGIPSTLPPPTNRVEPDYGTRGTTFSFTASGFVPGERVGTWTVQPDGSVLESFPDQYMYASDTPEGTVTWTWVAPLDAPHGAWKMVIRGIYSRTEWEIPFYIDAAPRDIVPDPQADTSVSPDAAPAGSDFWFQVSGYIPGEKVFFWAIDPNGRPEPNAKELLADANGTVTWKWKVEPDRTVGQWNMYTRGDASRKEVNVPFTVVGPEPVGIRMEPRAGSPGSAFNFAATGFRSNEEIKIWLTGPQQGPRRFDQEYDVVNKAWHADADGTIWWTWTAPAQSEDGTWRMTARGQESRIERVIDFTITRATPLGIPYAVSPLSGPPGTRFTFTVEDIPTSTAAYWITAPDGTIYPLDTSDYLKWRVAVDAHGHATWTWQSPPDAQRGQWVMIVRNLSDNLLLRRPKDQEDIPRYEEDLKEHEKDIRDQALEYREYLIYFTIE